MTEQLEKIDSLKMMIEKLASQKSETPFPEKEKEGTAIRLEELSQCLNTEHHFKVDQFVEWKPGLKNKIRPRINEPAIVIQLLEEPLIDEKQDSGSPYFREPLDMVIGIIQDNGLILFHVDKRRFKPYESIKCF